MHVSWVFKDTLKVFSSTEYPTTIYIMCCRYQYVTLMYHYQWNHYDNSTKKSLSPFISILKNKASEITCNSFFDEFMERGGIFITPGGDNLGRITFMNYQLNIRWNNDITDREFHFHHWLSAIAFYLLHIESKICCGSASIGMTKFIQISHGRFTGILFNATNMFHVNRQR